MMSRQAARGSISFPGLAVERDAIPSCKVRNYRPAAASGNAPPAAGVKPNISATLAPKSQKLERTPSGRPSTPGSYIKTGTYSRVWSVVFVNVVPAWFKGGLASLCMRH